MNRRLRSAFVRCALGAMLLGTAGCADSKTSPEPVPGTTYRISPPQVEDGSEVTVDLLWNEKRCRTAFPRPEEFDEDKFADHEERIEACKPVFDRGTGQVQMAFRLSQLDNANRPLLLPLEKKHVIVKHAGRAINTFEFEPFNPSQADQLFILLIDHSGSMAEKDGGELTRMERVREALAANTKTFVNQKAAAAVFRFYSPGSGMSPVLEGLDGEPWTEVQPITRPKQFKNQLQKLGGRSGYTPIYATMQRAIGPLLDKQTGVSKYLNGANDATPTVVLLTDGFNNTRFDEKCGDNAKGLSQSLKDIKYARRKPPSKRPEVYTVGFGTGYVPSWQAPDDDIVVTPYKLCGDEKDRTINADLETTGIDNISLRWLAKAGGGKAFIQSDYKTLAKLLSETSPRRHTWYKVKYKAPPFYHRTSFRTVIGIRQFLQANGSVEVHPSAWFDVPSGLSDDEDEIWVDHGDIRRATALTVPLLGGFILLTFLGPAMFNTRRALFRRAKKTSKK